MIEGFHNKKAMTIMSDQYEKIAQFITSEFSGRNYILWIWLLC